MKQQIMNLFLGLTLTFAIKANAQELPLAFSADVGPLFENGRVSDFTDKYTGYVSAKIYFNLNKVKLVVLKKSNECSTNICPADNLSLMTVEFDIKRIDRSGCYVSYYAKTPDDIKATYQERMVIQRFASEKCQSIAEVPAGSVHYRISGINMKTGLLDETDVFAELFNVKLLKIGY